MKHLTRLAMQGLFAAAMLAVLGFGATQALASSGPETARQTCDYKCDEDCRALGHEGGYCNSTGNCICYDL